MMHLSQLGLAPQRYTPDDDYTFEHHEMTSNTRRPLSESTGNAQSHNLGPLGFCQQGHLSLSPSLHAIPTPPSIVPTQAITSTFGTSLRNHLSIHRDASLRESSMGHCKWGRNPIYTWKNFSDYRAKVLQKEKDNEDPTWPLYLEDAFLDALLLVPQMGRSKFSSKGVLYGRNMLMSEYLWIHHCLVFPPMSGEEIIVGKDRESHKRFRDRKKVSSHIQVLKGFFVTIPLFHFFFPRKCDDKKEDRKYTKEEGRELSFKNNRVLIALAEGRLPDERPNYEYFARLLAADSEVFLRPQTCWIYVSSTEVALNEDCRKAYATDGSCLEAGPERAFSSSSRSERKGDYPHLLLNRDKDTLRDLERSRKGSPPKYLLHEYSKKLAQKESGSVREIASRWARRFPELHSKLTKALDDTHPSDELTSRCILGPCDTIQMEVALSLHSTSQFPSGTHLDGTVELKICRPELAHHRWRSVTSIIKPRELDWAPGDKSEPPFWDCVNPCDISDRQANIVEVPFPAKSWANTFIRLASYVTAERKQKRHDAKLPSSKEVKHEDIQSEDGKPSLKSSSAKPMATPQELLEQIAMYQEVWSAADNGSEPPTWTRRAVLLWTFTVGEDKEKRSSEGEAKAECSGGEAKAESVQGDIKEKSSGGRGKAKKASKKKDSSPTELPETGTSWRFLSKLDPASAYHQQHAYVIPDASSSPSQPHRDSVMSPNPVGGGYNIPGQHHQQQHLHPSLAATLDGSSSFSSNYMAYDNLSYDSIPYDTSANHLRVLSSQTSSNMLHSSHRPLTSNNSNGDSEECRATPTTSSIYAHSFDSATIASTDSLHHHLSFVSDGSGSSGSTLDSQGTLVSGGDHHSQQDPFLASLGVPVGGTTDGYEDAVVCSDGANMVDDLQAWASAAASAAGGHHILNHTGGHGEIGIHGALDAVDQWTATFATDGTTAMASAMAGTAMGGMPDGGCISPWEHDPTSDTDATLWLTMGATEGSGDAAPSSSVNDRSYATTGTLQQQQQQQQQQHQQGRDACSSAPSMALDQPWLKLGPSVTDMHDSGDEYSYSLGTSAPRHPRLQGHKRPREEADIDGDDDDNETGGAAEGEGEDRIRYPYRPARKLGHMNHNHNHSPQNQQQQHHHHHSFHHGEEDH